MYKYGVTARHFDNREFSPVFQIQYPALLFTGLSSAVFFAALDILPEVDFRRQVSGRGESYKLTNLLRGQS